MPASPSSPQLHPPCMHLLSLSNTLNPACFHVRDPCLQVNPPCRPLDPPVHARVSGNKTLCLHRATQSMRCLTWVCCVMLVAMRCCASRSTYSRLLDSVTHMSPPPGGQRKAEVRGATVETYQTEHVVHAAETRMAFVFDMEDWKTQTLS